MMTCKVCRNDHRDAIDKQIVSGVPVLRIAANFGIPEATLRNHKNKCLAEKLRESKEMQVKVLVKQIRYLQERALSILNIAEHSRDYRTALFAIRESRANIELAEKLVVESDMEARITKLEEGYNEHNKEN